MSQFTFAAQNTDNAHTIILVGNTCNPYQNMESKYPVCYLGKYVIDCETGQTKDASTVLIETETFGGIWAHNLGRTNVMDLFKSRDLDSSLVCHALATAPENNRYTMQLMNIFETLEFKASLDSEIFWRIRTMIDTAIGRHSIGFKCAELDIPVLLKNGGLAVSTVTVGRTFGLSYNDLSQTKLAKFNRKVGKFNGHRKPWQNMIGPDNTLETAKVAAWQAYNSKSNILNKFEITTASVSALSEFILKRLKSQPIRSLDNFI
jgi:hypothetical protein